MPFHPRRFWRVWPILALAFLTAAGCSKTPDKPKPKPTIKQEDADDIAQFIAATVAADNGGWFFTIKTIAESVAVTPAPGAGTPDTVSFSIAKGANTYNFQMAYLHPGQVGDPTRDTASSELDAAVNCDGGRLNANGVVGTYGYHSDWSFIVYGLRADHDTLEFDNIVSPDSSFAKVTSSIHGTERFWYYPDNYFDHDPLPLIAKSALGAGNHYPSAGSVNWLIEAYVMPSDTTRDYIHLATGDVLAEAQLTFNGTATATFRIVDILAESSFEFRYTINLDTGAFTPLGTAVVSAPQLTRSTASARAAWYSRRGSRAARVRP